MSKTHPTEASIPDIKSTAPSYEEVVTTAPPFWLLKEGQAPKLGARAEGGIRYHVLADANRQQLYIAITGNESGGYFSRERVPFERIESCLDQIPSGKTFPSKTFKETFVGRSSNNAGFLVAVLRFEGLLAAASGAESQHVRHGDMATWKKALLSEEGTLIAPALMNGGEKQAESESSPDSKEHKKTLTVSPKKAR